MTIKTKSCVIESRIRLSRNIKAYPFPIAMNKDLNHQMISELEHVFQSEKIRKDYHLSWRSSRNLTYAEQQMLQLKYGLKHKKFEDRIYQLVEDTSADLMVFVGANDHLRIQMQKFGLQLVELWDQVSQLDDQLDSALDYAFDMELGYLTSQVTEVGTGLHVSVLIHLPALTETGYIERVNQAASQLGLTLTGLSDRVDKGMGSLYRLENHVTLGRSEIELIDTIVEVIRQIGLKESDAIETLMISQRLEMEDRVNRSIGILSKARLLEYNEGLEHLSNIRMGIRAGLVEDIQVEKMDQLIFESDTGVIQMNHEKILNTQELKAQRANLCRAFFNKEV